MKAVLGILLAFVMILGMASPAFGMASSLSPTGHNAKAISGPPVAWSVSTADDANSPAWRTSTDIDSSDHPHISYYTWGGSLMYTYWTGSSWDTTQIATGLKGANGPYPAESIGVHMRTSLKLDSSNNPHISFANYADPDDGTLGYAFGDGSSFSLETADNTSKTGWFASLALNTSGVPYISYYDYGNQDLKIAHRVGSDNWTSQTIDSTGDVGRWTSIAIGSNNVIQVAYFDKTNNKIKYARYDGSWTISDVTTASQAGDMACSIALDSGNNPRIAYYSAISTLKYASLSGSWSSEVITGIDGTVDTGWWSSLAIDSANNPHVACFQYGSDGGNNYNLVYASKSGGNWSTYDLESAGDVGSNTSLALDSQGHTFIAHQNNTVHTLEVVTDAWPAVTSDVATNVTTGGATLNGHLASLGIATTATVSFEYGTSTSYGTPVTGTPSSLTSAGDFHAALTGLVAGQTYHYRAKAASAGYPDVYGSDQSFTVGTQAPQVSTTGSSDVTNVTATLTGNLDSKGSAASVVVYFEYGLDTNYGSTSSNQSVSATGPFNIQISGLTSGVTYHFRARADGGLSGSATGTDMSFPTKTGPTVSTEAPTNVLTTSVTLNGNLTFVGTTPPASLSFEYGTSTSYGNTAPATPASTSSPTTFSAAIINLTPGATYHYRAVANGGLSGMGYGNDVQFNALVPPSVTTNSATSVTNTSLTLNGTLTNMGSGTSSVIVSFEYGLADTSQTPGTPITAVESPLTGTGVFHADISGLTPATTYHFRAVANGGINGITRGSDVTITTGSVPPTVSTLGSSTVTNSTALVSGNLTAIGTAPGISLSFEYGLTTSYGASVTATPASSSAPASFTATISGLTPGTLYHFRAKADGGAHGASYGSDMTFTTEVPPTASTAHASNILTNSATLNGNLETRGSGTVVSVSFEYGTASGQYTNSTTPQAMPGTGTYNASVTGLTPGQTYFFRAKVEGTKDGVSCGTGYGSEDSFTTVSVPPTVSTFGSGSITGSSAVVSGNVTVMGTASTVTLLFEYGTTTNYGSSVAATPASSTTLASFTATITGLAPGTTYHFRAKADGGLSGIGAGGDMTFTTKTPPVVTTSAATSISSYSVILGGNITSLGLSTPPISASFEYGLNTSYGSVTSTVPMPGTGVFSITVSSGLAPGVTYHFRAVVDGGVQGYGYGSDQVFTTVPLVTSGGGGYVGGGGTVTGPGVTSLGPYINSQGLFNLSTVIKSEDGLLQISIDKGVIAHTSEDATLTSIKIVPLDNSFAAPADYQLVSLVYEVTPAGATFNPAISLTISYDASKISDNIDIDNLTLAVYNTAKSQWDIIQSVVNKTDHTVTASIIHFSQYVILGKNTPPPTVVPTKEPAKFAVSSVTSSVATVESGKEVTISATVSNSGGMAGDYQVILKINGTTEAGKTVTLNPGESLTVPFNVVKTTPGKYTVDVNGTSASFTVENPVPTTTATTTPVITTSPPNTNGTSSFVIVFIILGVVVLAAIIFVIAQFVRRNKTK
jgi:phosphodiesterase/alkaline phosphatase D-like protein